MKLIDLLIEIKKLYIKDQVTFKIYNKYKYIKYIISPSKFFMVKTGGKLYRNHKSLQKF